MSAGAPLFTFGVIADVQYADLEDGSNFARTRTRYYRNSLQLLRKAREHWSGSAVRPEFVLQLGDLIDGFNALHGASRSALDTVLREFRSGVVDEVHHVWGNHELYNFSREELLTSELNSTLHVKRRLGECCPGADIYAYSFSPQPGFTFIVLDAYDMSLLGLEESSEQYQSALRLIQMYNSHQDLNSPPTPIKILRASPKASPQSLYACVSSASMSCWSLTLRELQTPDITEDITLNRSRYYKDTPSLTEASVRSSWTG
uniref:ADP-ribose/CDP-alcohol diphosphatase, manganese-dependent n=1 Tax=Neogobius melanostomus TaxID=47308 RepID=A0A8C6TK03_9GOBI